MTDIHPTAIVESGAEIGSGVVIEPYVIVKKGVVLKDNVLIKSRVVSGIHESNFDCILAVKKATDSISLKV